MLKINVYLIFIISTIFLLFSIKKEDNEILSIQKKEDIHSSMNTEEIKNNEKIKIKQPSKMTLQTTKNKDFSSIGKVVSSIEETERETKGIKHLFNNSAEVFDTYFPNVEKYFPNAEKEFGVTARERFTKFIPITFLLRVKMLTEEQRQEYKKIAQQEKEDYTSFSKDKFIISDDMNSDGFETMMTKRIIVKDYYLPLYMNILTKEQQLEFAKKILDFFDQVDSFSKDPQK